ncbi:MAG TPA: NfeD family protein [Acidimicrobiales bacterium]|nr:NfeD family protein [Acidimicrobiales bacterium]
MGFLSEIRKRIRAQESPLPARPSLFGKVGVVSATIPAGGTGEVRIAVRGTTEAFSARAADDSEIPSGTRVTVVEELSPQAVQVTPL